MIPAVLAYPLAALLTPLAWVWLIRAEHHIFQSGTPLSPGTLSDAIALGIRDPENIRTLTVPHIPGTESWPVRLGQSLSQTAITGAIGLTANHGIYLTPEIENHRETLAHELVHVRQYQRLGSPHSFLFHYLAQCLMDGYWDAPLEQEARHDAQQLITYSS